VYTNDILTAQREIIIVSPFITRRCVVQMIQHLDVALRNGVRIVVVTRGVKEYRENDQAVLQVTIDLLRNTGVKIIFRTNIHQKFAVMDQKIVWYGSINLLSFGSAEESVMRLGSSVIANELVKSVNTI
jgi:phosphatidylserine/phosphatidylglycerophosphate/cardiolipin synthase-like enzyme